MDKKCECCKKEKAIVTVYVEHFEVGEFFADVCEKCHIDYINQFCKVDLIEVKE